MEDFTKEYCFFDEKERKEIFDGLYPKDDTITDTLLNRRRPNVLTIILEGLSANLVEELGGMEDEHTQDEINRTDCLAFSQKVLRKRIKHIDAFECGNYSHQTEQKRKNSEINCSENLFRRVHYSSRCWEHAIWL